MPRAQLLQATEWITELAVADPCGVPAEVARRMGLHLRAAYALCMRLVDLQWLQREGSRRKPRFVPGQLRQVVRRYALAGLAEDQAWAGDFAPNLSLPPELARMAQHAFTELVNNAIEHSGGTRVTVSLRQTPWQLQLLVSDDGAGVFDTIGRQHRIADPAAAMLELAKGKLTTQPDRHTGRGLYFTSRLADVFDLHANGAAFQQRAWATEEWVRGQAACAKGSSVYLAIAMDTPRTLDAVMRSHSLDGEGYRFERTSVPLALLASAHTGLESRAMARRVADRLTQFKRVELDFKGLADVGHAFVDELWRVFGRHHPQLQLVPVNMAPRVAAMVDSVRSEALTA